MALVACSGDPLPDDKLDYVGNWQAAGITLAITPDGGCSYSRVSASGNVRVNGPIRSFEGDSFVVGIPMINTTFEVSAPPHAEDDVWKMTVDGVELSRTAR